MMTKLTAFLLCGAHGLCAIEAAQDALVSAVSLARTCREQNNYHAGRIKQQIALHTARGKYVVNSILALHRRDFDLVALWLEAAQKTLLQCQSRHNDRSRSPAKISTHDMCEVAHLTETAARQTNQLVAELMLRAARNRRLFVVHSVLGRVTGYEQAAKCFENAAKNCLEAEKSASMVKSLYSNASATLRRAAEMMEKETHEFATARKFSPTITDLLRTADAYACDAKSFAEYIKYFDETEDKCNRWPGNVPIKAKLAELLAHVRQQLQDYVGQAHGYTEAEELMGCIYVNQSNICGVCRVGDNILLQMNRATFFREQAIQHKHIAHPALRDMWVNCYTRAAACVDKAARLETQVVLDVTFDVIDAVNSTLLPVTRETEVKKAQLYEYCASCLIETAVQYYNSARGAQGSLFDPREAQWWSAAAECQIQVIAINMEHIAEHTSEMSSVTILPPAADKPRREATIYRVAAGYMAQARMYSSQSDTSQSSERIASLYVLAAELTVGSLHCTPSYNRRVEGCAEVCLRWAEQLSSGQAICVAQQVLIEKGYQYAVHFLAASSKCTIAADKWWLVVNACADEIDVYDGQSLPVLRTTEMRAICAAYIALLAYAAEQWDKGDKCSSVVFGYAAEMLPDTLDYAGEECPTVYHYCTAIIKRVTESFVASHLMPSELTALKGLNTAELTAIPVWQQHIDACRAEIECRVAMLDTKRSSICTDAWQAAESAARSMCDSCTKYSKSSNRNSQCEKILDQIALQKRLMHCTLSVAKNPSPEWA